MLTGPIGRLDPLAAAPFPQQTPAYGPRGVLFFVSFFLYFAFWGRLRAQTGFWRVLTHVGFGVHPVHCRLQVAQRLRGHMRLVRCS